jgi:hypothetical protein
MTWQCKTIQLSRPAGHRQWEAEVPGAGGAPGRLVGWEPILNYCSVGEWELVTVLPLHYQGTEQGLSADCVLAVFKRHTSAKAFLEASGSQERAVQGAWRVAGPPA